jgi:hypothetical protein
LSVTVRAIRLASSFLVLVAFAACGSSSTSPSSVASPIASAAPSSSSVASEPIQPTPGEPTPATTPAQTEGQTDTEWGRIWDSLPAGFPKYPGATLSEEAATGPASATYVVEGGEPKAIATWFRDAFEAAAFSTEALSGPLEDGSYVLDSIGQDPACRLSVAIAPLGGTTTLNVMYGASCPHD